MLKVDAYIKDAWRHIMARVYTTVEDAEGKLLFSFVSNFGLMKNLIDEAYTSVESWFDRAPDKDVFSWEEITITIKAERQ